MQCPARVSAFEHAPQPCYLIDRLEKRMISIDVGVLPLDGVVDGADHFGSDLPHFLHMLRDEQKALGIDVAAFDEAAGLLGTAAGIALVHESTLAVHETVQVAPRTDRK